MEFKESLKKIREHYKRIENAKRKAILIKPLSLKKRKRCRKVPNPWKMCPESRNILKWHQKSNLPVGISSLTPGIWTPNLIHESGTPKLVLEWGFELRNCHVDIFTRMHLLYSLNIAWIHRDWTLIVERNSSGIWIMKFTCRHINTEK